jgi:hypothetical protein
MVLPAGFLPSVTITDAIGMYCHKRYRNCTHQPAATVAPHCGNGQYVVQVM